MKKHWWKMHQSFSLQNQPAVDHQKALHWTASCSASSFKKKASSIKQYVLVGKNQLLLSNSEFQQLKSPKNLHPYSVTSLQPFHSRAKRREIKANLSADDSKRAASGFWELLDEETKTKQKLVPQKNRNVKGLAYTEKSLITYFIQTCRAKCREGFCKINRFHCISVTVWLIEIKALHLDGLGLPPDIFTW